MKEKKIGDFLFFIEVFQRHFDEMLSIQAASSYMGWKVSQHDNGKQEKEGRKKESKKERKKERMKENGFGLKENNDSRKKRRSKAD